MVPNSLDGSGVVIQTPLYFRKIRDSSSETLILGEGEAVFDSPRLHCQKTRPKGPKMRLERSLRRFRLDQSGPVETIKNHIYWVLAG